MAELSGNARLRPTRIGFLVRPADVNSIRKIMRSCACLWGGSYNPIIPVFRTPPKEWRNEKFDRVKSLGIARGYVNFFEPDVYVEAESGLLEEVGLGALREKHTLHRQVVELSKFLTPQGDRDWSEPAFGLGVSDVYRDLYRTEHRFKPRKEQLYLLVKPQSSNGLVEAIFGAFPKQSDVAYIADGYKRVFAPTECEANPATWLQVFKEGAETPLRVTRHGLEVQRYWHHDLVIFVFDATRPTDLIDLWNLRLEPRPILPVPIDWFSELKDEISAVLRREFRPVRGNPNGVMHHPTIEFGRSIPEHRANEIVRSLVGLPAGAVAVKHWRNRIWVAHKNDLVLRDRRLEVTAEERKTTLNITKDRTPNATFETLTPKFASRFGGHDCRWINALRVSRYSNSEVATIFPFNTFDRRWPRLASGGDWVGIGSEGWIFGQRHSNWTDYVSLVPMSEAIVGWLKRSGIEAKLSEPGHIAKQMLDHIDGLWSVHLFAEPETLQLLNNMAGGVRKRNSATGEIEESFERRSAPLKKWTDLIARRKEKLAHSRLRLSEFTKRNIIRLGLETHCPHCQATNWHSLSSVDYSIACERCLKSYEFPQATLSDNNRNWHYRVIGPFSVPDYGRGSYSSLLTLRLLKNFGSSTDELTFSTAMELKFDQVKAEADFIAWRRHDNHDVDVAPELIIGESKSLGQGELFKPKDVNKLKAVGRKLPGAILVLSVLRSSFTVKEKKLLRRLSIWGRRPDDHGLPTNPVVLLTSNELFFDFMVGSTWDKLGEPYKKYADYEYTHDLIRFAEATQAIYLGLPSFHESRKAEWEKRATRKKQRQAKPQP